MNASTKKFAIIAAAIIILAAVLAINLLKGA